MKRRAEVVGIFPNETSIARLIGAVLFEQNDEWATQHRNMQVEGERPVPPPRRAGADARYCPPRHSGDHRGCELKAWSDDEKRLICGQTRRPGMSVSQVARRYDVNANLVFKWLRDPRFAVEDDAEDEARFLPVKIVGETDGERPAERPCEDRIEIELAGGHNLKISGAYDPDALARLIRGLSA